MRAACDDHRAVVNRPSNIYSSQPVQANVSGIKADSSAASAICFAASVVAGPSPPWDIETDHAVAISCIARPSRFVFSCEIPATGKIHLSVEVIVINSRDHIICCVVIVNDRNRGEIDSCLQLAHRNRWRTCHAAPRSLGTPARRWAAA